MLITDKEQLKVYTTENRIWQGIPSIEVTHKGRIFVTFYSGNVKEHFGNYVLLIKSDDGGKTFSEPIAACYKDEDHRCYDPVLWIDPLGRLWFIWAFMPANGVYASICENPDADELVWSKPRKIGNDVMMCRPTVLSTGEWLFPIAVWRGGLYLTPGPRQGFPTRKPVPSFTKQATTVRPSHVSAAPESRAGALTST